MTKQNRAFTPRGTPSLLNGSDFKWSRMMKVSVEQEAQTTMDDEERTKTQDARGKSSGRYVAESLRSLPAEALRTRFECRSARR